MALEDNYQRGGAPAGMEQNSANASFSGQRLKEGGARSGAFGSDKKIELPKIKR